MRVLPNSTQPLHLIPDIVSLYSILQADVFQTTGSASRALLAWQRETKLQTIYTTALTKAMRRKQYKVWQVWMEIAQVQFCTFI